MSKPNDRIFWHQKIPRSMFFHLGEEHGAFHAKMLEHQEHFGFQKW